jgi:hypothetical protein
MKTPDILDLFANPVPFAPYEREIDGWKLMMFEDCSYYEKWVADDLTLLRANDGGRIVGLKIALAHERMGYYLDEKGVWHENGVGMGWCKLCGVKIRLCRCS